MSSRVSFRRRTASLVLAVLGMCAAARAQSAEDGFNPGANGNVYAMAVQADGKILAGGAFTEVSGPIGVTARNHLARLNADGSLDPVFDPGANGDVDVIVMQADGKILVGGDFTTLGGGTRNRIGRLNADGSLDPAFNPGANGIVYAITVQADGKILVGGAFTTFGGGGAGVTVRNRIARLNADGSLDTSFNPGANEFVYTFAVQPDGKILTGGAFTTVGGGGTGVTARNRIARLNPDGSLDAGFNPGADSWVLALVIQPDGRILAGGSFLMLGGGGSGTTPRSRMGRLNADGSLDVSFNPGANDFVLAVTLQANGQIVVGGGFTRLGGGSTGVNVRNYLGRLNADGALDASFDPGANNFVYAIPQQADGMILLGGNFTRLGRGGIGLTLRLHLGRLSADGLLDDTFNPGADKAVFTLAVQPDGKILVGGDFDVLGGAPRHRIGRLNADGSPDAVFNPGADDTVWMLAVRPDGKVLVGGDFTTLGGAPRSKIGRLNANGAIDPVFNPGANGTITAIVVQDDGKILVGGLFTMLGGGGTGLNARSNVGRLGADGLPDGLFDPGANEAVAAMLVQPDGKIVVAGTFTMLGGGGSGTTSRQHLGRLNADGSLDPTFNPGANGNVYTLAPQPDGKILVGGEFTMLGGGGSGTTVHNHIGRLNADGTVDATFNAGANDTVYSIALQSDGNILVSGYLTALSDVAVGLNARSYIGRFTASGSLDVTFNPGAENAVLALALQADGKILAGGGFSALGAGAFGMTPRAFIGRLTNTGAAIQSLAVTAGGGVVTWSRRGAGPELRRVTFESSTDGATYTPLGSGTRVADGWQLSGLSLPARQNLYIRARGFYRSGLISGSDSIVESIRTVFVAAACTYSLSSSSASVPSGVNIGSVVLTTNDASCPWTAPGNGFITVTSGSGGVGTTLVSWVTAINPSPSPRTAAITIGGLLFTIAQAGASTTRRVPNDFNHDAVSDIAVFRPSLGRWFIAGQPNTDWGAAGDMPVPGDYDGDGAPEVAVFRPANGTWYVNGGATVVWGLPGDIPVPGDYNGDHVTDIAVFRPGAGQWLVRNVGTFGWGLAGDLPVPADYDGDGLTDIAVYRPSTGTWYVRNITTAVWGFAADIPVPADYNGDGTADIAVFRPATGTWLIMGQYTAVWGAAGDVPVPMDRSGDGIAELGVFRRATGTWYFKNRVPDTTETLLWGAAGDVALGRTLPPVATSSGDFDGDRKADLTVFRPATGDWITLRSLTGFTDYTLRTFGLSSDIAVARDYDGDGKIDPAVFRPSTGRWFTLRSSTNFADYLTQDWGISGDIPVPGDYDGDGKADAAVFRASVGRWLILLSSSGNATYLSYDFGLSSDIPVPADYDGDGRTDVAVFRPSTGRWYVYNRITATYTAFDWGVSGDVAAPADFDGDGKADLAVFRPSLGRWFIKSSIDGSYTIADWGLSGDLMVPADFDGDGKADLAVFRPSTGMWYVRGLFNRSWGLSGDIPALRNP